MKLTARRADEIMAIFCSGVSFELNSTIQVLGLHPYVHSKQPPPLHLLVMFALISPVDFSEMGVLNHQSSDEIGLVVKFEPLTSYITSLQLYGSIQQLGRTTVKLSPVMLEGSGDEMSIVGCPDIFGMCLRTYFLLPENIFISASPT